MVSIPLQARHPLVLVAGVAFLALSGCSVGNVDSTTSTATSPVSEQTAAVTSAAGVLLESSTEQILDASSGAATRAAGQAPAPDFVRLAGTTTTTYSLGSLTLYGRNPFASAQGTVTVTTTGAGIASWPSGTGQLYTGSVTVSYAGVQVVTTDGDRVTLADGSFSYTLEAVLVSKTDDFNWVVTTSAVLATAGPLTGSVVHNGSAVDFSLSGRRQVDNRITRVKNGSVNTRTTSRTVFGTAPGSSVATTSSSTAEHTGVTGYTAWTIASMGVSVTWNRYAEVTTVFDFARPTTLTISSAKDFVFLSTSLVGQTIKFGPMNVLEAGQLVKTKLDQNFL